MNCTCPSYSFPHRPSSGTCLLGGVPHEWAIVKGWKQVFDLGDECPGCPHYESDLGTRTCTLSDERLRFCPGLSRTFLKEP